MNSDSGVVMRMCGGRRAIACRSDAMVSPVRTAARISGSGVPISDASAVISDSGSDRLRWMSFDSAFSGETYTTCVASGSPSDSPCRTRPSTHVRNAASVFPDPVGADISVCRPRAMAGHPCSCAAVGAAYRPSNHRRTIGWNPAVAPMTSPFYRATRPHTHHPVTPHIVVPASGAGIQGRGAAIDL